MLATASGARTDDEVAGFIFAVVEDIKPRDQVEAKYRTGGEQKVTVQHVTVNDGGQAVVGNISPKGGGGEKN